MYCFDWLAYHWTPLVTYKTAKYNMRLHLKCILPEAQGNRSAVPMVPRFFLCTLFSLLKRGDTPSGLAGRLADGLYTEIVHIINKTLIR